MPTYYPETGHSFLPSPTLQAPLYHEVGPCQASGLHVEDEKLWLGVASRIKVGRGKRGKGSMTVVPGWSVHRLVDR